MHEKKYQADRDRYVNVQTFRKAFQLQLEKKESILKTQHVRHRNETRTIFGEQRVFLIQILFRMRPHHTELLKTSFFHSNTKKRNFFLSVEFLLKIH